jgi:2-polyprenyl-3-methyl-5-hydroxy-6-metoxy-1,4-benzoquinol methylase
VSETQIYESERSEVREFLERIYPSNEIRPKRILEIGCAVGLFRKEFPDAEYWGVEPNSEAAVLAHRNAVKVYCGTYDEVKDQLPDDYFDMIVVNDVIEHVSDHDSLLNSLQQKGKSGFYLLGSIPNVRFITVLIKYLIFRDWEYKNSGVLDRTHLRFFTLKSLKKCLKAAGYEIIEVKGINALRLSIYSFKDLIFFLLSLLFGADTRFIQFAFLARCVEFRIKK